MLSWLRIPEETGLKQDLASRLDTWPISQCLGALACTQEPAAASTDQGALRVARRKGTRGINHAAHAHCWGYNVLLRKLVESSISVELFLEKLSIQQTFSHTLGWAIEMEH